MNYNLRGSGVRLSGDVRQYLDRRLEKAEKFLRRQPHAQVDVELVHHANPTAPRFCAEFTAQVGKDTYHAEATGGTLQEAIDIGSEEFCRELGRAKDKKLKGLRRQASRLRDFIRGMRH